MNRFHHLERTLLPNLESLVPFGSVVEWVVVNYNSEDNMDAILRDYAGFIRRGHLTYYLTREPQYFNFSHAKNLSHILASGDYVVNLDADNFLDINGISNVLRTLYQFPEVLIQGLGGLIGLKKSHFLSLGGYDEDLQGWGQEDNDLISRARRMGLTHLQPNCLRTRIEHGDIERVENFDPALLDEFEATDPYGIKIEMNERNGRKLEIKAQHGVITANENRMIGKALVTKNFSNEEIAVGWISGPEK